MQGFEKSKKIVSLLVCFLFVYGCGQSMVLDVPAKTQTGHKTVQIGTYGLFNQDDQMNPNVKYRIIIGNVIWSVILCETIVVPIYFIGWSLYEPVRLKTSDEVKGEI